MAYGTPVDLAIMVLRLALASAFLAHGWNHIFGGGKIAGTARWFASLGMTPGRLHAWTASLIEPGSGVLLILGLATPVACAGMSEFQIDCSRLFSSRTATRKATGQHLNR